MINYIKIKKFLSFDDVTINFKKLTAITGLNGSGKSNILKTLDFFRRIYENKIPNDESVECMFRKGNTPLEKGNMYLELDCQIRESNINYCITVGYDYDNNSVIIETEELLINGIKVIDVKRGEGIVYGDDGQNPIKYSHTSDLHTLALSTTGCYGENKVIINNFSKFIERWALFSSFILTYDYKNNLVETLRYLINHQKEFPKTQPSLLTLECPEQNLHPEMLIDVAKLLQEWSEHTQVIFTTHSPQLIDLLNKEQLGTCLDVVMLTNTADSDTKIINLSEQTVREQLQIWIDSFGIGSAIFDSERLHALIE